MEPPLHYPGPPPIGPDRATAFEAGGEEMVPGDGIEPPTLRFSVACSTN